MNKGGPRVNNREQRVNNEVRGVQSRSVKHILGSYI